jgi:hypothetical protein
VTNLGNMAHLAIQLLDFVPKSVRWIMQYVVEHYHAGEATSPDAHNSGIDCFFSIVEV